jgi:hypothetical protein
MSYVNYILEYVQAKPYLMRALENKDLGELPDPRLENKFDEVQMHRMIEAAAACVRHSANMRPRMGQVILLYCPHFTL